MAAVQPLIVAHRGDSGTHPENTLPAFAAAIDAGATMIEFDVRETADAVVVCIHDDTLDRTTDVRAHGRRDVDVASLPARELEGIDAGSWKDARFAGARVPTLEAALECMRGRTVPMIEHKAGGPEPLLAVLQRVRMVEEVLVQSFDWELVAALHRLEPRLALGALGEGSFTTGHRQRLPATGASLVHWDVHDLRHEDVDYLRRTGRLSCVYTANSDVELAGAAALGLDAITTNHPRRLRDLVVAGVARRR